MARTVLEVFLSSTAKDLSAYRDAVSARLTRIEFFRCIRQEDFGAQDAEVVIHCSDKARAADLFVGLVGLRRGWEPKGDGAKRSITEIEHDAAKEAGRRRYLWVSPDEFPVPGNLHEARAQHARQLAFRKRVLAAGERIVSQKGFASPDLLAAEILEQLLAHVVTGDLITLLRPEFVRGGGSSVEEQTPAVAAAVEKLATTKEVDLLTLAKNPKGVDITDLHAKLRARAEAHEAANRRESKAAAEYWRHIGALAFLHDTTGALAAYDKAVALDPDDSDGWRYLGELQRRLGELSNAEKSFRRLLELGRLSAQPRVEAMGHLRLGAIQRDRGALELAERSFEQTRKLSENNRWTEGMARAYANLGVVRQERGEFDKAETVLRKALKLYQELGSHDGMARAYSNLGVTHQERGELDKAEQMHLRSLKIEQELGNKEGMAADYGNLGTIHRERGELDKAEQMHLKALTLEEELGHKEGMADGYGSLGCIYERKGDKARMLECWRKARDLWREMELTHRAAEVEQWLQQHGGPQQAPSRPRRGPQRRGGKSRGTSHRV